jgi:hypothetical protein
MLIYLNYHIPTMHEEEEEEEEEEERSTSQYQTKLDKKSINIVNRE